jgi:glycosyltransferase involved in cell wall biosynthesis
MPEMPYDSRPSVPSDQPPKVSVAMITYNHEKFIAQAIEGVLMQQTDFSIELVIGEDCSTDGTRRIVEHYSHLRPDLVRPILHPRNVGIQKNGIATMKACRGNYIALCEGDDYWTAPGKLAKQAAFLEGHPECSSCFHPVTQFYDNGHNAPTIVGRASDKQFYSLEDIIYNNMAPTCSLVYRNYFKGSFPEWYHKIGFGDWALQILHAERGLLGYIDEVMASYRIHAGGVWSTTSRIWQLEQLVFLYKSLEHYLPAKYRPQIRQCHSRRAYQLSVQCLAARRVADARRYAWQSIFTSPFNPSVSLIKRSKQLLLSLAPPTGSVWAALRPPKPPTSGVQRL